MAGTPRDRGGWEEKRGEAEEPMCPCLELDRDLEQLALGSSGKFFGGRKKNWFKFANLGNIISAAPYYFEDYAKFHHDYAVFILAR